MGNSGKLTVRQGWLQKNKNGLLAFLAVLACLGATCFLFGIRYQLNDDAIISNIAAGAYGEDSQYLVYVNILFGWVLKGLYFVYGGVNWFVVLLLAGGVFCFTILGELLLQKLGTKAGLPLFICFLVLAGVDFFHMFHYVKYAALFLATGLALLAQGLGKWNIRVLTGLLLAVLGSMLRFQQLFAVGGLSAAVLLWIFFTLPSKQKWRAAISVAALLALAFGLKGIDTLAYRQNAAWASYAEFNEVRTDISDFRLQFAAGAQTLAPLGYTVTDFEMLETWNYYDPQVFSTESLTEIVKVLPGNTVAAAAKQTVLAGAKLLYETPAGILLGALLLCWVFVSGKKKWLALLATLGVLGLQIFLLQYAGRYPNTISFSLALSALVFCAFCFEKKEEAERGQSARGAALLSAVLVLCTIPALLQTRQTAQQYWADKLPYEAELVRQLAEGEGLYLVDVQLVDAANGYNVWQARPAGYFSDIVFTGSWLMNSPFQQQALQNHGLTNLYKDSLNRADVIYVETVYRQLKEDYLRQHYSPKAQLARVQDGELFSKYRAQAAE